MLKNKISQQNVMSNALHRARREYLQAQPTNDQSYIYEVTPHLAYQFRGDFYGLLNELNEPSSIHLLTLELNNLDSSMMYNGFTEITLINTNLIPKINGMREK